METSLVHRRYLGSNHVCSIVPTRFFMARRNLEGCLLITENGRGHAKARSNSSEEDNVAEIQSTTLDNTSRKLGRRGM